RDLIVTGVQTCALPIFAEMKVRLHEVEDREVVLAIVEPCAATNDLFELNHGVDRAHENDVANVAGIHAGRELLRSGQNRRNGLRSEERRVGKEWRCRRE